MDIDTTEAGDFEDRRGQNLAVGGDDDKIGLEISYLVDHGRFSQTGGLKDGQATLQSGCFYRRREGGTSPPRRPVRPGVNGHHRVPLEDQVAEGGNRKPGRTHENNAQLESPSTKV